MLPVIELGHEYFLVGKKVIFGLYPGTFDVLDRDEALNCMAANGPNVCKADTITDTGFEVAYGYAPYRHDDGLGTRWVFRMLSGIEDIPDDVKMTLQTMFPGHPGFA